MKSRPSDSLRIRYSPMLALALGSVVSATFASAEETKHIDVVMVAQQVAEIMGRHTTDLISSSDVPVVFAALKTLEVSHQPDAQERVMARVLPQDDKMVRHSQTRSGRAFMQRIARYRLGFDRLDRLRRMPHGRYRLHELIRGPDGHLLIAYMTNTRGGRSMGRYLSEAPKGGRFNEPTGRLYTIKGVVKFLSEQSS